MIPFFIGLLIGAAAGVVFVSLAVAASDEREENPGRRKSD